MEFGLSIISVISALHYIIHVNTISVTVCYYPMVIGLCGLGTLGVSLGGYKEILLVALAPPNREDKVSVFAPENFGSKSKFKILHIVST